MLIGDSIKTDLRERYLGKGFSSHYMRSIGVDFALYEKTISDKTIKFQIWDIDLAKYVTENKKSVIPHGVGGIILVINAEKPASITEVEQQIKLIRDQTVIHILSIIIVCVQETLTEEPIFCYSSDEIEELTKKCESLNSKDSEFDIRYLHVNLTNSQEIYSLFETLGRMYLENLEFL
ncbi:MAG: hypothetical protein ACFFDT_22765 [Candidatus Hodarchaeota archaeon]